LLYDPYGEGEGGGGHHCCHTPLVPTQGQLPVSHQFLSSCSSAFRRWGWEARVRKELSAVTQFFAHCCYYIKEAAGEIMYAEVLCKLSSAYIIVTDNHCCCFIPRLQKEH
jgi:hypothetical protein